MRSPAPESDIPWFRRKTSWFFVLGMMVGFAMSATFALGIWVGSRGDRRPLALAEPAPTRSPEAVPAGRVVEPSTGVARVDGATTTKPDEALSPEIDGHDPGEETPTVESSRPLEPGSPPTVPATAIATGPGTPGLAPGRFVLPDAPRRELEPFLLPTAPWFALGAVSADEPAEPEPIVCRADRALDTALTWARSPAEASEQAAREGKLVFLIHVSGNFEDPGFT